eukprot:74770_1
MHVCSDFADELLGQYKITSGLHDKKNNIWTAYIGTITNKNKKFASNPKELLILNVRKIFETQSDAKLILRELRILNTLSHDNIIKLYDIIPPNNPLKFNSLITVVEYAPVPLSKILKSNQFFSPQHIRHILYQIMSGIQHIHSKHIAHRNLTTSAIWINDKSCVKITDFLMAYHFGKSDTLAIPNYCTEKWSTDHDFNRKIKSIQQSNISDRQKQLKIKNLKLRKLFKKKPISKRKYQSYWKHGIWYQPPDIILSMLDNNYYATMTGVDIWSIGAIFGELLQMQKNNISNTANYIRNMQQLFHGDFKFMTFVSMKQSERLIYLKTGTHIDDPLAVITEIVGAPCEDFIAQFNDELVRNYLQLLP